MYIYIYIYAYNKYIYENTYLCMTVVDVLEGEVVAGTKFAVERGRNLQKRVEHPHLNPTPVRLRASSIVWL